jgi:hypothetical protein
MKMHFAIRPLRLGTGELFTVRDGKGFTVTCLDGSVWITQSDDGRDIVLIAGQAFVFDQPGVALVCAAAGPATLAIERPPQQPLVRYFREMRNAAKNLSVRGSIKPDDPIQPRSDPAGRPAEHRHKDREPRSAPGRHLPDRCPNQEPARGMNQTFEE